MLRVTPIYGSRWNSEGPASHGSCTLVEYASVKVLVNVGGPPPPLASTSSSLPPLESEIGSELNNLPDHDCLVISDSTLECMGGLPLYSKAFPNKPIYATFPTVKMGQMTLWDYHAHICLDGGRPPFSLEEMDAAIQQMQTIKYSQAISLPLAPAKSTTKVTPLLSITAHRAAHVVGGAFWVLQRLQDETVVVVTSTYSIAKELHLDSSTLLKHGATPDVLVTRPGGPAMPLLRQVYAHNPKLSIPLVAQAQRKLTEQILSVLRRDGNVLLPADASGRVLELILLLSQHWEKQRLQGTYNLVWLGPMVGNTLDYCRSQLEWMNGKLGNQFDSPANRGHPYALTQVQLCTNVSELETFISGPIGKNNPTCVVANGMSLDHGPARDLLLKWADNDNNAVLFTDSAHCRTRDWHRATSKTASGSAAMGQRSSVVGGTSAAGAVMSDATGGAAAAIVAGERSAAAAAVTAVGQGATPVVAEADEGDDAAEEDEDALGQSIALSDASPFCTAFQLLQNWCQAKLEDREMEDSVEVDLLIPRRAPLVGQELQTFLETEEVARQARRKEEEQAALLREVELAKGRLRLGEDGKDGSSNDSKRTLPTPEANPKLKFFNPKKKSRFDSNLFLKFSKPLHLTFQVREDAVGVGQKDSTSKFGIGESMTTSEILEDDYGIAVLPDHFTDIVTGVDPSKFAGGSGRIGEDVLRRGLGFAGDGKKDSAKGGSRSQLDGGVGGDDDGEDGEALDERGMEAMDLSEGRGIIRGRNGRPPKKVVTEARRIQVLAEIDYIPLEGRVDSRSARQSVRALQPRQVVVLGGPKPEIDEDVVMKGTESNKITNVKMTTDEVQMLADAAQGFITTNKKVLTPSNSETAALEVGHAAYSVRLIATPFRTQAEKAKEEEPPEPVELHEAKLGACTVSLVDYVATGQKVALDGSIVVAPRKTSSNLPSVYLSDGEVLLTNLRTELIAQGMKAEYSTHSGFARLLINGKVIVKKEQDSGRLDVEGPLCEAFFTVRSVVCGQYVTL